MLAHFKPDDGAQDTFDGDLRALLTSASLRRLRADGLFALSLMDSANLDGRPETLAFVGQATRRFGRATPPRRP